MRASDFYKKMGSFGKGTVNKISNVMAAPARARAAYVTSKSGLQADVLRQANASNGAPQRDASGAITDAFKIQSVAEGVKEKMMRKSKKK